MSIVRLYVNALVIGRAEIKYLICSDIFTVTHVFEYQESNRM